VRSVAGDPLPVGSDRERFRLTDCGAARRACARWATRCAIGCLSRLAVALPSAPVAAASAVRSRILTLVRQEIGYREPGNYCTIFGPCEEWCSLFVTWVWRHAGVPVPSLAFTGYLYDWARSATSVHGVRSVPQPGDAVLFGTGPSSVSTSLHVGIVEAAYPGYLVTIEGDSVHGVRRFVVPVPNPQRIGEPGPIYAYASPVSSTGANASRARTRAVAKLAALTRAGKARRRIRHMPSRGQRRLLRTIAALRAFQHMPYRFGEAQISWTGVDSRGRVEVNVASAMPVSYARSEWAQFLQNFHDAGNAYTVKFQAPPDPPVNTLPPAILGTPQQAEALTESHGTWSSNPTGYSYQWQACDSSGNNCAPIAAATSETYEPTAADVGHSIRVQEIATNPGGAGQPATSAPTAVIAPALS
jgi:CHAP domain